MNDPGDKYLDRVKSELIADAFRKSQRKLILLDYDGTLVPYNCDPSRALPDESIMKLLKGLLGTENLDLVIISGRNREFLEKVFSDLNIPLFAEHGSIYRIKGKWGSITNDLSWQHEAARLIEEAVVNNPGSFLEKKKNSLVWHYRKADQEKAGAWVSRLTMLLAPLCTSNKLLLMKGRKIIEVKPSNFTKGTAILNFFDCSLYDFILAAGDDVTDEDLFEALPAGAITIHIGKSSGVASFRLLNSIEFISFLNHLYSGRIDPPC